MNTLRKCRHWLVFGLCLTLLSCSTSMRALDFTPLPDMGHVRAKVDVSGIKYNLRFDDRYPIGGILNLAMPCGLALMVALPLFPFPDATLFLIGPAGLPLVAASLVAPERTFAKTFQATIILKDTTGKVLLSKTFDRNRSDCASVYQRGSSGCKKINRTMAQAIDEIFASIANELAFQMPPS